MWCIDMKRLTFLVLIASVVLAGAPAFAHTSVRSMSIAENARLAEAPESFTVEFSASVGLAAVALTGADDRPIPLAFTPTRQMATRHTLALPVLAAGDYTLSWRTISADGHAMSGAVRFTITG